MLRLVRTPQPDTLSPRADLDPYLWLDTGGECYQPQRGVLTKPRPTAWVKMPSRSLAALKGRDRGYSPPRCHPFPCLAKAYFALSGLATRRRGVFRPRPLAWAVLGRPYRARWGVGNARTRGVQQKIWDTLSPRERAIDSLLSAYSHPPTPAHPTFLTLRRCWRRRRRAGSCRANP